MTKGIKCDDPLCVQCMLGVTMPNGTGKDMTDYLKETIDLAGEDSSKFDGEAFWNASSTGELYHVFDAFWMAVALRKDKKLPLGWVIDGYHMDEED